MKIDPNIALSETGFLFHAATGDSYSVNPVGLKILELIRKGEDAEGIIGGLTAEFDVTPAQAEEDLDDYIQFLKQLKIILDE
jgi:hypothetical protein